MGGYADLGRRLPARTAEWGSEEFAATMRAWVAEAAGPVLEMELTKLRPWACVWRVRTAAGWFYAKQNCDLQVHESGLLGLLTEVSPHHVVPVAALDPALGRLLTVDHGPVLGESAGADLEAWRRTVVAGAELQRELMAYADRLAGLGLTAIAPADAPAYLERRLDDLAALPPTDPRRPSADLAAALRRSLPTVRGWADEVAALGLPLTLNHNDLHERNVFLVDDELRFFDFADAMLTEPLAVLHVPLKLLADQLSAGPGDRRLWRVAEAALEVWSDLVPMAALRRALPSALLLSLLPRLEVWVRCSVSMSDAELAEWGSWMTGTLDELLRDPPVGRRPG